MSEVPPPSKWKKGRHEDHDVLTVEVLVRRDHTGRVYSGHRLQNPGDKDIALSWPGGGLEAVAFALLAEAVRREAVLDVTLQASHDRDFLARWKAASEEERADSIRRMAVALRTGMDRTVARIAEATLRDALAQFTPPEGQREG